MTSADVQALGIAPGKATDEAIKILKPLFKAGLTIDDVKKTLKQIAESPASYTNGAYSDLAYALMEEPKQLMYQERLQPASFKIWGKGIEEGALQQMRDACRLPVTVKGALMGDAHQGYGLPIGGVLATKNEVIPYGVGVDIGCSVCLTVTELGEKWFDAHADKLSNILQSNTYFGMGATPNHKLDHEVMDSPDWEGLAITTQLKNLAWSQLGSSGSGNHFVEFGLYTIPGQELKPFLAILSHSGSRGAGAKVAKFYSDLAKQLHPELPAELRNLAWLDLDREAGEEYWIAMNLMGSWALANHKVIHDELIKRLGNPAILLNIHNSHNLAWREIHNGEELIVHRKGATPAFKNQMGVIPGSMATSTYAVAGLGNPDSLMSASHGAGRRMSRTQAKKTLNWEDANKFITKQKVNILSAGIDEVPDVYKDIDEVMECQNDLVEIRGRFMPRIVKMAPETEPAED